VEAGEVNRLGKENDMEILNGLDPDQDAAARAPAGASLIAAGAGTGKTRVLAARVAHLISSGVPASKIVAVTFTRKAAGELQERISQSVGPAAAGLRIGTFHYLSSRILRRYAVDCGLRDSSFEIVDETHAKEIMTAAAVVPGAYGPFMADPSMSEAEAKAARKEWDDGLRGFVTRALAQVSHWKAWGLTDVEAGDPSRPRRETEMEEKFAAAYCAYQYELDSRNLADFGDLIMKPAMLMRRNAAVREVESSAIIHMLVDEAQDADWMQVEWVRLLTSHHGGLTVVGDEDQNIYGFKGGYPKAMEDMAGPSALRFTLKTNRRCTEEILKPAVTIVGYNRRREKKTLVSGMHGAAVRATGHPTEANEAAWVAARIAEIVTAGADPAQIAVLFRSSFAMAPFEEALARKGVKARVLSGVSLLDREEVRDVVALLKLSLNPFDDTSFMRLANKLAKGVGATAADAIVSLAKARDVPLHEACRIAADAKSGITLRKEGKASVASLAASLSALAEEGRWGPHAHDLIKSCLRETSYISVVREMEQPDEREANVEALLRLAESCDDAGAFLQDMMLLADVDATGADVGKVRLMTIHASKGLEFDHVFCPAFDDGVMPNPRAVDEGRKGRPGDVWNGPRGGGVEEERRLAHVAFTRARRTLDVSFPWKRTQKKGRAKIKGGGPSSFVEEANLPWKEVGPATSAELGRAKTTKKSRAERLGYDRG
jgi:DNA helicase-2/ATP-dependent DNA helicase PcrA